jgi:hypothetical protein
METARRYAQKSRHAKKPRHFGMDAESQAMEGKIPVLQMFDLDGLPASSFTSLDT